MAPLLKFAVSLLTTTAAAIPAGKPQPECHGVSRNASFEGLTGSPGLNPMPASYEGLYFQGFDSATVVEEGLGFGVIPRGKTYVATNAETEQNHTPILTVHYENSDIQSFDLSTFFFGCVKHLANATAAEPVACNIQISGYQATENRLYHPKAKRVCNQVFQYVPHSKEKAAPLLFSGGPHIMPCFRGIQLAVFTFTEPGVVYAAPGLEGKDLAMVLDDIQYTTYSCKR